MANFILSKATKPQQYFISITLVAGVAAVCFFLPAFIHYKVVALVLLMVVSLLAMFLDIFPVLLAAALSAFLWDFLFIPPHFTITVGDTEDRIMLLMYFVIAALNAALTYKIRDIEKQEHQQDVKDSSLKLYNTLLNSLSHELRTPISTIIGATDNLQTDNNKLSEQNRAELIGEISKAAVRLNSQVENLLNMSRLESGVIQAKKDWCDVNELVHDVVNRLKESSPDRVINISIKENFPLVKLDFGLMEQVLHNLIHNAIQYIPGYAVITVRAVCVNHKLILVVEDNGSGFPDGEKEKVFEKFYRLKNSDTGGTGLGLSIVKGFVEAHGGTIRLENMPEGGARFTIEIPAEISYVTQMEQ